MNDIPDFFQNRKVDEDDYDNEEFRAARIRLGLQEKKAGRRKKKRRRLFVAPNLAAKVKYQAVEGQVFHEKAAEHKVSVCRWCRGAIWQDLFGEQWKAKGGSPTCQAAPFMTHEPSDE